MNPYENTPDKIHAGQQKTQASVLSRRYGMPEKTVLKWMRAENIFSFDDWMLRYGPRKFKTNAASHEACYQDIVNFVMAA